MTATDSAILYLLLGYLIGTFVAKFLNVYRRSKRQRRNQRAMATRWDDPRDTTGKFKRIFWQPK